MNGKLRPMKYVDFWFNEVLSKDIYENQIPIKIKSHDREDWSTSLTLKMYFATSAKSRSNQHLHMELSDEANYLFLYLLEISESDFLVLKGEQSLIVDFQAFPNKLIDLIELCYNSSSESRVSFICTFEIRSSGEATFSVVETNNFKALTHLQLKFRLATDDTLKSYLSTKLQGERQANEDLRITNRKLAEQLNSKTNEFENLLQEYRITKDEIQRIEEQFKIDEKMKINEFAERSMEKESRMISEWENHKKEIELGFRTRINELESRLSKITQTHESSSESKYELEASLKELTSKFKFIEKERNSFESEVTELRKENKDIEAINYTLERKVAELTYKLQGMEQQILDKQDLSQKDSKLVEEIRNQNRNLEEQLESVNKRNDKLEKKISKACSEIDKGNEIISKLQSDLEKGKKKLKLKNSIALNQEQTVVQQSESLDKLNRELNEVRRASDMKDITNKEQESAIGLLKSKLTESQKLIESNNSMIQYLNKCINETGKPLSVTGKTYQAQYTPSSNFNVPSAISSISKDQKKNFSTIQYSEASSKAFNSPTNSEKPRFKSKYMETLSQGNLGFYKDREIETFGMSENRRPMEEERPRQIQPVKYIPKVE